jgi:hypothetical protein
MLMFKLLAVFCAMAKQSSIIAEWAANVCALDLVSQDVLLDELTALHNVAVRDRRRGGPR